MANGKMTDIDDLELDISPMPPDPLIGAAEIRLKFADKAPQLLQRPAYTIGPIVRAIGMFVETAAPDDAIFQGSARNGQAPALGALWCHEGRACFAWDLDNPPTVVSRATVAWTALVLAGHWLMFGDRIGNYSDLDAPSPPKAASTFVADGLPPVAIFDRLAHSFAAAFMMPPQQMAQHCDGGPPREAFGALIERPEILAQIASNCDVPSWAVAYRLRDMIAHEDFLAAQRRSN